MIVAVILDAKVALTQTAFGVQMCLNVFPIHPIHPIHSTHPTHPIVVAILIMRQVYAVLYLHLNSISSNTLTIF
jgi:hypothetical protein